LLQILLVRAAWPILNYANDVYFQWQAWPPTHSFYQNMRALDRVKAADKSDAHLHRGLSFLNCLLPRRLSDPVRGQRDFLGGHPVAHQHFAHPPAHSDNLVHLLEESFELPPSAILQIGGAERSPKSSGYA